MSDDDIAEVRRARHEISAMCHHDLPEFFEYLRSVQDELKRSGQFRFDESSALAAPPLSDTDLTGIAEDILPNLDRDEAEHS